MNFRCYPIHTILCDAVDGKSVLGDLNFRFEFRSYRFRFSPHKPRQLSEIIFRVFSGPAGQFLGQFLKTGTHTFISHSLKFFYFVISPFDWGSWESVVKWNNKNERHLGNSLRKGAKQPVFFPVSSVHNSLSQIQSGPKVTIQCILYNYCIPTFGLLCMKLQRANRITFFCDQEYYRVTLCAVIPHF
jgi:hypothetical protein